MLFRLYIYVYILQYMNFYIKFMKWGKLNEEFLTQHNQDKVLNFLCL